jgi:serine protease Do
MSEKSADGARIMEVTEASAADRAGLKKDDIITKINDKSITGPEQLSALIATMQPKEKITVTYKRDNKENKAEITLGGRKISRSRTIYSHGPNHNNMPEDFDLQGMNFNFDQKRFGDIFSGKPRLGIKAQDTEEGKGVKVVEVDEDSPAAKAGLKEDDLITSFEGKDVNSAEELAKASRESKDKSPLKVQVKRNGKSQNLEIKIPKKLKTADL